MALPEGLRFGDRREMEARWEEVLRFLGQFMSPDELPLFLADECSIWDAYFGGDEHLRERFRVLYGFAPSDQELEQPLLRLMDQVLERGSR